MYNRICQYQRLICFVYVFFTEEIVIEIAQCTNISLDKIPSNWLKICYICNYKTTLVETIAKRSLNCLHYLQIAETCKKQYFWLQERLGGHNRSSSQWNITLNSNSTISMLSLMETIDTTTRDECKLEVITFYNLTKGAVVLVDQMNSNYSVPKICCRWSLTLTIFSTLINIVTIKSQIIRYSSGCKGESKVLILATK